MRVSTNLGLSLVSLASLVISACGDGGDPNTVRQPDSGVQFVPPIAPPVTNPVTTPPGGNPANPEIEVDSGSLTASFSLIEDPTGVTIGGGPNITGRDPKLAPLADNGGPTQTQALRLGSPALDKGKAAGGDQRGATRPFFSKHDDRQDHAA